MTTVQEIVFNIGGNYVAALFWCAAPLIVILLGILARMMGWSRDRMAFARRYWYMPLLVPLVLYYGFIYWWLFYDQFYRVLVRDDNTWQLEYRMPTRTRTISADDIADFQTVTGDIRTYRMIRIAISTKDGEKYLSAQVAEDDADFYLNLLQQVKESPTIE